MSKSEFSKEFSIVDAKAGAPYRCRNGQEATVLKWDCRGNYKLVGVFGEHDDSETWQESGSVYVNGVEPRDLVMLPLGMIDGKPVFVGDELADPNGAKFAPGPSYSGRLAGCKWPAPAKVYPETQLDQVELTKAAFSREHVTMCISGAQIYAIANAAISGACDAGQVIPADEHKAEIADLHSKWVAQITEMNGKRAERDMAVARAAKKAVLRAWALSDEEEEGHAMESIGLEAIISSVTP